MEAIDETERDFLIFVGRGVLSYSDKQKMTYEDFIKFRSVRSALSDIELEIRDYYDKKAEQKNRF